MTKVFPVFPLALAALCLAGYLSLETFGLNARLIVVLFWLSLLASLIALVLVRPKRLAPLLFTPIAWALLWPATDDVMVWSAWWINGFGP